MGAIPPRGKVMAAYRLRADDPGASVRGIAAYIGEPHETVRRWLEDPALLDPFYDPVAIKRAMLGDTDVFDNLTRYEHRLVVALLERVDTDEDPATNRFPQQARDKIQHAIARRRARVEQGPRVKHCKIAPTKLTPEVCAKAKALRQQGRDFAVIGEVLGISRSSVFRAINAAA